MPYSNEIVLNANVSETEPASNQWTLVNLNNPGLVAQNEYLISFLNGIHFVDDTGASAVSYTPVGPPNGVVSSTLTGLPDDFEYSQSRQGWIKIKDNLGIFNDVEVIQYSFPYGDLTAGWTGSVFKVLQVVGTSKSADYDFVYGDLLVLDNTMEAWIEGSNHAQNDTTGIGIGSNGTSIYASYDMTINDQASLAGEELYIRITVRQENAFGALIVQDEGARTTAGLLRVPSVGNLIVNDSQITGSKIWVQIELGSDIPI